MGYFLKVGVRSFRIRFTFGSLGFANTFNPVKSGSVNKISNYFSSLVGELDFIGIFSIYLFLAGQFNLAPLFFIV